MKKFSPQQLYWVPSFERCGAAAITDGPGRPAKTLELSGVIKKVSLGNPHGILEVEVRGEMWTIEVGQPWRNERAGLKDGDLSEGVEIRVIGEPAADKSDKRLKAERLFLGDREYILYPDRD